MRVCKTCGDSSSGNHRKRSTHGSRVQRMPHGEGVEAERGLPEEIWMGDGEYDTVMDSEKSVFGHQPVPGSQLLKPLPFPMQRVTEVSRICVTEVTFGKPLRKLRRGLVAKGATSFEG